MTRYEQLCSWNHGSLLGPSKGKQHGSVQTPKRHLEHYCSHKVFCSSLQFPLNLHAAIHALCWRNMSSYGSPMTALGGPPDFDSNVLPTHVGLQLNIETSVSQPYQALSAYFEGVST